MPKKHQPSYLKTSNSYVHPSLGSSKAASTSAPSSLSSSASSSSAPPKSVNQRLAELRREQTPRATAERRNEITDAVTHRTVPPALRRILNLPESVTPRARSGVVNRVNARRVPGPPPPRSWLETSIHAPHPTLKRTDQKGDDGSEGRWGFQGFSALPLLEDSPVALPDPGSLMHFAMKTLATNWECLVEYEQNYLATLPVWVKEALLSYLVAFGPPACLTLSGLKILFLDEPEIPDGTGGLAVKQLDFSNMLNERLTIPDVSRYINSTNTPPLSEAMKALDVSANGSNAASITESWEDEADDVLSISKPISTSRFPNLTRLSLSGAGKQASWTHLLRASQHLSALTHLSLAYWPTPSTTPNALTADMVSKHVGPISLGGTNIYSGYEDDWHEAASILRRLSKNVYCLRWLDLEGCRWHAALTWGVEMPIVRPRLRGAGSSRLETQQGAGASMEAPPEPPRTRLENWQENRSMPGPNWNGSWRHLEYINLSQGWVPSDISAIRRLPAGLIGCELLGYLRERQEAGDMLDSSGTTTERQLRFWMEMEKEARKVGSMIRAVRLVEGGVYCKVDHGWSAPSGTVRTDGGGPG